jgi:hypothetical protein
MQISSYLGPNIHENGNNILGIKQLMVFLLWTKIIKYQFFVQMIYLLWRVPAKIMVNKRVNEHESCAKKLDYLLENVSPYIK